MIKLNNNVELPEEVKQAVNQAQDRVRVLNEQVVNLEKSVNSFRKENAKLDIENDEKQELNIKLSNEYMKTNENLEEIRKKLSQEEAKLIGIKEDYQSIIKDIDNKKSEIEIEVKQSQDKLEAIRKESLELDNKRLKLQEDEQQFENRKNQVIELLKSIK